MAKYGIFVSPDEFGIVAMKTTVGSPADGDWDSQDNGKRLLDANSKVKSLWAYESSNPFLSYDLFDVSDAGPNDPDTAWGGDTNAFELNTLSAAFCAVNGSAISNYLEGEGVAAAASGPTIGSVSIVVKADEDASGSTVLGVRVTTDAAAETLLSTTQAVTTTAQFYIFNLSAPSGGWTYAKLQALEIRFWRESGTADLRIFQSFALTKANTPSITVSTQQENGRVSYHVFHPGTDTWVIFDDVVAIVGDHADFDAPAFNSNGGVSAAAATIALRADGGVVIGFMGEESGGLNQIFCITRIGATWGTVQKVLAVTHADSFGVQALGPDASDRITFVFEEQSNDINTRSLNSSDVLQTNTEIESGSNLTEHRTAPGVMDSGDKIYVPYIDIDARITVANWPSGDAPTISIEENIGANTVNGSSANVPPFASACLAVVGTDIHLLYSNSADSDDIYYDEDVDAGGTGATDVEINDAVTADRISAKTDAAGSNILYFYKDTGTAEVVYDTIGLENFVPSLDSFRYYEDGTETGATAIDTQDTDISRNVDSDSNLQIRIRVQEQGPGSIGGASTDDWQLQFDKNTSSFFNVTGTSPDVKAFPSAFISEAAVTTNRLGAGSGSFVAGEIDETNGLINNHELTADNFTEYLWSVTLISADLANGDTLDFRVLLNGSVINSDIVPRITAVKSLTTTPYYYQQLNRLQGVA